MGSSHGKIIEFAGGRVCWGLYPKIQFIGMP